MLEEKEKETPMDEIINKLIPGAKNNGMSINTNNISDGYHTFGELYEHRITLFITLAKMISKEWNCYWDDPKYPEGTVWKSVNHSDGSNWEGWFILGVFTEAGEQMTYHLPINKWEECDFAKTIDKAPEWDGHTSEQVLERLKKL